MGRARAAWGLAAAHARFKAMEPVNYELVDRIAILTIQNPPVNALGTAVQEGLRDTAARAMHDCNVDAIVITGAGTTFIVSADIKQLERMAYEGVVRPILPQLYKGSCRQARDARVRRRTFAACREKVSKTRKNLDPAVEALIERTAQEAGTIRRSIAAEEIIERTIAALINEGSRILEESYALRASDIDLVYVNGYRFPAYRGGPMHYADEVGLQAVYRRMLEFRAVQGPIGNRARYSPF